MSLLDAIVGIGTSIAAGIGKISSMISTHVVSAAKDAFKLASVAISKLSSSGGFIGSIARGAGKLASLAFKFVAGPLGGNLGPIVGKLVLEAAIKAVEWLSKKLGVIKEDDKVEEVGYRLEEAGQHDDWEKREAFGSFAEYNEYLKEKVPANEIDRDRLAKQRLAYETLGTSALKTGLENKYGLDMPVDFLIEIGKCRLDGEGLEALLEKFSSQGYDLTLFRKYLQGELTGDMRHAIEETILSALTKIYPEKNEAELKEFLSSMKNVSRDDAKIVEKFQPEIEVLLKKPKEQQVAEDLPEIINVSNAGR